MNVISCVDEDWLLSEEAFLLYASCMYQPRYENFKKQIEIRLPDLALHDRQKLSEKRLRQSSNAAGAGTRAVFPMRGIKILLDLL